MQADPARVSNVAFAAKSWGVVLVEGTMFKGDIDKYSLLHEPSVKCTKEINTRCHRHLEGKKTNMNVIRRDGIGRDDGIDTL